MLIKTREEIGIIGGRWKTIILTSVTAGIFLFFLATGFAIAEKTAKQQAQKKQSKPNIVKKTAPEEKSAAWPQPFMPSEKIDADSVMSFPADI